MTNVDLTIRAGETFSQVIRWESLPFVYSPITGITQAAPAVITSASHGLKTGWRAAVLSAGGMRQINAKKVPPLGSEFHPVTVVDPNTINFNDVNSAGYTTYTSGGFLVSYTAVSLAAFTAKMEIRKTVESADPALVTLNSPADIVFDDTNHTITITIAAAVTATYPALLTQGVYDLDLTSGTGVVTRLIEGTVTIVPEVTR